MFRRQNLTAEQLRAKFLEIAEGEQWFSSFYESSEAAAAPAAASSSYDASQENVRHITALFGPPPWEFLQPGDAPDHIVKTSSRQRMMIRNPAKSEYKAMRGSTPNYSSLPKKPQFVVFADERDTSSALHLWIPGSDARMLDVESEFSQLFEQQIKDGELMFNYRRPKGSKTTHLQANQSVTLLIPRGGSAAAAGDYEPFATLSIHSVLRAPRSATATLKGMIYAL